ncbi:dTMP kinase [Kangiella koreensis]|uniref:Thymidylate kinase n=1 Tax=Kangiella koreensis (strain DSM 16069 / JCM 12317 / KCTC 12182 / SW-125) TaxID=523791 RepID=C7RBH0_KANKD|nr:dTMP kinase [Kangiella koreensis]ACV26612.1 thymidylate kinase [Kangiella koreensis DSM 16069]
MTTQSRGKFITIEGTEGVGKSTNIAFIKAWFEAKNISLLHTREPGGTPFAEEIRELLLSQREEQVDAKSELLLMYAARAQHVSQKIKPALEQRQWVLCDRFSDASFAYQGAGRALGLNKLSELDQWVLEGFKPDLTILLDLPVEVGLSRAQERGPIDRFEEEKVEFFEQVRQGYLQIAQQEPERMKIVDARGSLEKVQQQIEQVLIHFYQQQVTGS